MKTRWFVVAAMASAAVGSGVMASNDAGISVALSAERAAEVTLEAALGGGTEPVAPEQAKAAEPERGPTLISVPSNTLGAGVPLWARREMASSQARRERAVANEAEARAEQAAVEARRAADDPDQYAGVVIYGPHRPGLWRALRSRPLPPARAGAEAVSTPVDDSPFDAAQRRFAEAARPPIGPIIRAQQDAVIRAGEATNPPVIRIQQSRDDAVIKARRGLPKEEK